jgi:hypothetical protein
MHELNFASRTPKIKINKGYNRNVSDTQKYWVQYYVEFIRQSYEILTYIDMLSLGSNGS